MFKWISKIHEIHKTVVGDNTGRLEVSYDANQFLNIGFDVNLEESEEFAEILAYLMTGVLNEQIIHAIKTHFLKNNNQEDLDAFLSLLTEKIDATKEKIAENVNKQNENVPLISPSESWGVE